MAEPVATNTAASGYRVDVYERPYRHYTICPPGGEPYKVPSVTTVIGVVDKSGPLQHYASNETLKGVATVLREHEGHELSTRKFRAVYPGAFYPLAEGESEQDRIARLAACMKQSLRRRRLMFYDATDRAATRGLDVHGVLEDWAESRKIPNLKDHPEPHRGYIRSLAGWLSQHDPEFVSSEVVVGSAKYGYAGRMDTVVVMRMGDGRKGRLDLKTSKAVYPRSMFPQLQAYEHAEVEMGGEPTDFQAILRVDALGGEAQLVESRDCTFADFRVLLDAHRSQSRLPESLCQVCAGVTKRGKCPKGCNQ